MRAVVLGPVGAIVAVVAVYFPNFWSSFSGLVVLLRLNAGNRNIVVGLSPLLSPNASIVLPGSAKFELVSRRWQTFAQPDISVFVEVASEEDVQQTIKFANRYSIPFLAVSGGHGCIESLATLKNGIGISMRKLNHINVQPGGKTALIGGGTLSKEIVDTLWAHQKQTVTGACECTGIVGPMLGGGHGWLQGRYGLSADNLIEARMVLANGTAITVSDQSHSDLFWAIRGAGHNFGIVTEFLYKIYDVPAGNTWTVETLVFTGDKVEELYQKDNELGHSGKQPVEVMTFQYFLRISQIDPLNLVILFLLIVEGSKEEAKQYSAPFHNLKPASAAVYETSYPNLAGLTGVSNADPACQHGLLSVLRFPVSLQRYDVGAQRKVFDLFNEMTTAHPALNGSMFLWERYSVQGVQAIPSERTAYPDRSANILASPALFYPSNKSLDNVAIKIGKEMRKMLRDASNQHEHIAYVNYAFGDEPEGELYGHEKWRLERLRALKRLYDPRGMFNFYAPIK